MKAERIAELRALVDAATESPWEIDEGATGVSGERGMPPVCVLADFEYITNENRGHDAAFIAAARTAVPELLDEVLRRGEQIDRAIDVGTRATDQRDQLQADYLELRDELGTALHEVDRARLECIEVTKERDEARDNFAAEHKRANLAEIDLMGARQHVAELRAERDTARGTAAQLMEEWERQRENIRAAVKQYDMGNYHYMCDALGGWRDEAD